MALANAVSFTAASAGSGSFVFGVARASFFTPAQAVSAGELIDGNTYSYLAQDSITSPNQREWGSATFVSATSTFIRNGVLGSVNGGVPGGPGTPVSFTINPIVSLTALSGDIGGGRLLLTTTTNYYVSATGSDSGGTGSIGNPWKTLQHAINALSASVDFGGQKVILNVPAGSFAGFGMRSMTGGGNLLITGTGRDNTTIGNNVADNLYSFGSCIDHNVVTDTILSIDALTLQTTDTVQGCFNLVSSGVICCFGDFLTFTGGTVRFASTQSGVHALIAAFGQGLIFSAPGAYYIHPAAASTIGHWMQLENGCQAQLDGAWHVETSATYSSAFITLGGQASLYLFIDGNFDLIGTVTGQQFNVFGESYLDNSGRSLASLPGTVPGIVTSGSLVLAEGGVPGDYGYGGDDSRIFNPHPFANAPTPIGFTGTIIAISDSPTPQVGQIITVGGGTFSVLARSNGTNWVVYASDNAQAIRLYDDTHTLFVANLAGTVVGGSGYGNTFTYTRAGGFPFTGGSGSGGTITSITVTAGVVTAVTPANVRGSGYMIGDVLGIDPVFIGADLVAETNGGSGFQWTVTNATTLAGTLTNGGSGYGHLVTYFSVPLTGGSGTGATADIQVIAGVVSFVSPRPVSSTYVVGDVLSASNANLGGAGSGFTFTITAIGNDTTGTGTSALPFATGQAAWNFLKFNYYLNGHALSIQFRNGVYPGIDFTNPSIAGHGFNADMGGPGGGYLQLQGNSSNVDAVVLDDGLAGSSGNGVIDMPDRCDPIICVANMQLRNQTSRKMFFLQFPNAQVRLLDAVGFTSNAIHMKFRTNTFTMNEIGNGLGANLSFYDQSNWTCADYTDSTGERSYYDIDGAGIQVSGNPNRIWGVASWGDAFIRMLGQSGMILKRVPVVKGKLFGTSLMIQSGASFEGVSALETFWPVVGTLAPYIGDGGLINDSSGNPNFFGTGILTLTPWPFASLVSASRAGEGSIARIQDSNSSTLGATITGGGGFHVFGMSDGTNWRVMTGF